MKKKTFIILMTIAFGFSACSKIEDLLTFNIDNSVSFAVPSATGVNLPFTIPTPDVTSNSESAFANNNTRADLVKNVSLEKLDLKITSPSGKTFSFLKSISISISADGLPTKEIAFINDIPTSAGNSISLETTSEDLDEYIKKPTYNISTEVVLRETFFQDVDIDADLSFKITADLL